MTRTFIILALALSLFGVGCNTVTLVKTSNTQTSTEPDYKKSKPFFLFGLVGTQEIDVRQICSAKGADQIQSQESFLDGFLSLITLGIYTPRSVKVWCTGESSS